MQDPANLFFDPASGDWGLALFGHVHNTAAFLVRHEDLGWQCYFCDLVLSGEVLSLVPRDSCHRRVFIAPLGLHIVSDAGTLARVVFLLDAAQSIIGLQVSFSPVGAQPLRNFRLRLLTRSGSLSFNLEGFPRVRGAFVVAPQVGGGLTTVNVTWA